MDARYPALTRPLRHLILGAFGVVAWFLGIALSAAQYSPPNDGSPPIRQEHLRDFDAVTLQLPYTHQFQFAGYYAAVERGSTRRRGWL